MKWILVLLASLALVSNAYASGSKYSKGFVCDSPGQVQTILAIAKNQDLARLMIAQNLVPPCPIRRYTYDAYTPIGNPMYVRGVGYVQVERVHITSILYRSTFHFGPKRIVDDAWVPVDVVRYVYIIPDWRPA